MKNEVYFPLYHTHFGVSLWCFASIGCFRVCISITIFLVYVHVCSLVYFGISVVALEYFSAFWFMFGFISDSLD